MAIMKSDALFDKIAPALGLDDSEIRRIIIDLNVGYPVKVYVEMFGDDRLLKIKWADFDLVDAEITLCDKGSLCTKKLWTS